MEKQRILVVDDDREIVKAIAINLQNEGYEVLQAYDGLQALDMIQSQRIHLIILDVMMPKLDGLSTPLRYGKRRTYLLLLYLPSRKIRTKSWDYPLVQMIM